MEVTSNFPPVFATNRPEEGESVADQINLLLHVVRSRLTAQPVAIATAYINPAGFALLADELERVPRVRLLIGAEPDPGTSQRSVRPLTDSEVREAVADHEHWMAVQRDLTGFTRVDDAYAKRLVAWLTSSDKSSQPRVEVRKYNKGFLHGKAYIVDDDQFAHCLAGSSNFTYAGLARNAELNLGYPNTNYTHFVQRWFEDLWDSSESYDLAGLYSARWEPHAPWVVFLRMLWELYGDTSDDDAIDTVMNLTGFQREGVARMLRILDDLGGVIVADEVGLGKTFMAAEVMRRATEQHRQRVLVISPAALKSSMWEKFLRQYDMSRRIEVLSYEELRNRWNDPEDGEAFRRQIDEYALVVIDEAHNLRNPGAQRSEVVNALLGGTNPKKTVLLTATPVNNSLFDLHALIRYFVRNDARFADIGIPSIHGYVQRAQQLDPDSLSPEHLFDLIDRVAVRRTRKFIRSHYAGDAIRDNEGNEVIIVFPDPKLKRLDYELDELGTQLINDVVYALDSSDDGLRYDERQRDPGKLMLARYTPGAYTNDSEPAEAYQIANAGLLRSGLLKRLESSPAALASSLGRLIDTHEAFLSALGAGYVIVGEALAEWTSSESEDFDTFLAELDDEATRLAEPASSYHIDTLRNDVADDLVILNRLKTLADQANDGLDPKAACLVERLREIADGASRLSVDGVPEQDRRKTIVFSTFTDTIRDIWENVVHAVDSAPETDPLSRFKGRIAGPIFGSKTGIDQYARARTLAAFAPETAGDGSTEDRFDLLFTTDVLSEGVNLQQAGRMINYDLPWNPMRVVQRHGRIDRIGSKHRYVYLDCFFPAEHLDQLLELEKRLHRKLTQADAAVGVGEVLPGFAGSEGRVFQDTEEQIRRIAEEDESFLLEGGAGALSGEEYRRRLQKATGGSTLQQQVEGLPYGSGSGFISVKARTSGYTFCARIEGVERPVFRFVPTDRAWSIRHDDAGNPVLDRETLTALSAADPGGEQTGRQLPAEAYEGAFEAWEVARRDILTEWNLLADPKSLAPSIPKAMKDAANLVADHGGFLGADQTSLYQRLNTVPPPKTTRVVRAVLNDETLATSDRIRRLAALADEEGLEAPPPPPRITPVIAEQIQLVAWMAVDTPDSAEILENPHFPDATAEVPEEQAFSKRVNTLAEPD